MLSIARRWCPFLVHSGKSGPLSLSSWSQTWLLCDENPGKFRGDVTWGGVGQGRKKGITVSLLDFNLQSSDVIYSPHTSRTAPPSMFDQNVDLKWSNRGKCMDGSAPVIFEMGMHIPASDFRDSRSARFRSIATKNKGPWCPPMNQHGSDIWKRKLPL